MNQETNKQLIGGGDMTQKIINNKIPKSKRETVIRATKKTGSKKVAKVSLEQGFRNYVKHTDPLLLTNNEDLDKSELNDTMNKILEFLDPNQAQNDKLKEVQNFVLREEPVDVNDIGNEIPVGRVIPIGNLVQDIPDIPDGIPIGKVATNDDIERARQILKNIPKSENVKKIEEQIFKQKHKKVFKQASLDGKDRMNDVSATILQSALKRKKAQDNFREQNKKVVPATTLQSALKRKKAQDNYIQQQKSVSATTLQSALKRKKEQDNYIEQKNAVDVIKNTVKRKTSKLPKEVKEQVDRKKARDILKLVGLNKHSKPIEISNIPLSRTYPDIHVPKLKKDGTMDNRFKNKGAPKKKK